MTSTRRFLFDTEFDADVARRREERLAAEALTPRAPPPPPEPEEPPPPPEPVFKSADLLQAHEDGYADGFANGKAAAEAAAAARVSATLERLADQLEYIVQSAADTAARQREGVIRIGAAISRKLLPDLSRRQGTTEAEAMLGPSSPSLSTSPGWSSGRRRRSGHHFRENRHHRDAAWFRRKDRTAGRTVGSIR